MLHSRSLAAKPISDICSTFNNCCRVGFLPWLQSRTVDGKPTRAQLHHHTQEQSVSSLTSTRHSTTAAVKNSRCQAYQCSTSSPHSRTRCFKPDIYSTINNCCSEDQSMSSLPVLNFITTFKNTLCQDVHVHPLQSSVSLCLISNLTVFVALL